MASKQYVYLKRNLSRTSMRGQPEVMFRIRVIDSVLGNDKERTFFQARSDSKCPFCNYKSQSHKASVKHCFRFHLDHHTFSINKRKDGSVSITNSMYIFEMFPWFLTIYRFWVFDFCAVLDSC